MYQVFYEASCERKGSVVEYWGGEDLKDEGYSHISGVSAVQLGGNWQLPVTATVTVTVIFFTGVVSVTNLLSPPPEAKKSEQIRRRRKRVGRALVRSKICRAIIPW